MLAAIVSSRILPYGECRARSISARTKSLPSPCPRNSGRTYNRFISQIPSSNLRKATQPAGIDVAEGEEKLPFRRPEYSPGNPASSASKL